MSLGRGLKERRGSRGEGEREREGKGDDGTITANYGKVKVMHERPY